MKIYNSGRERRASSNFGLQMFVRDGRRGEFPKLSREIRECNAEDGKTFLSRVSERDECRVSALVRRGADVRPRCSRVGRELEIRR